MTSFAFPGSRFWAAVPAGARFVSSDAWPQSTAFAVPFALASTLTALSLSILVTDVKECFAEVIASIYADGNNLPAGAPLATSTFKVKGQGAFTFQLSESVALTEGSYWMVSSIAARGKPPLLAAIDGESAEIQSLIGAATLSGADIRPVASLMLPQPFINAAGTLAGDEAWQDLRGRAGAPIVFLGS